MDVFNQETGYSIPIIRNFMTELKLNVDEEFYLKIAEPKQYGQYKKLPKNGYLGIQDIQKKECFLVKFKFLPITYEFTSDCIYITQYDYKNILNAFINSEYIIEKREPEDPFYIQCVDSINIYNTEEEDDDDTFNVKVFSKNILNLKFKYNEDENNLTEDAKFRKYLIQDIFKLNIDEEFYLKIYKEHTTLQYNKKLKEQYLGLKDYDMGVSFLIKFKFILNNYKLYSDCKYLSEQFYDNILAKMIFGKYIITKQINYQNRVSIFILDNISIYQLDYEEDKIKFESDLDYQSDKELEYYNLLSYTPLDQDSQSSSEE